ncbi:hypothetical protein SCHPADRAFT_102954 [Schizopora paradoxa]|uniref:Uncharacterized protein n=1 Tax=Schizopora paradoxa TaxID=27342 RepID=A0A0H2SAT3_9AGAM|nr:hypothetical protein SCHPADRAFT_102954 [Schizopora paradoxa]
MPAQSKFTKIQQAFLATHLDKYNMDRAARTKKKFKEDVGAEFLENWQPIIYPPPPPLPPGADPSKQPPPPPTPEQQRAAKQRWLDDERKKQVMNWYGNNTGSRAIELVKAGKVSRAVLIQLILGGIQKRRISKLQASHAYLHMFRD